MPKTSQYSSSIILPAPDIRVLDNQAPKLTQSLKVIDNGENIDILPIAPVPVSPDTQQNLTVMPENKLLSSSDHKSVSQPVLNLPAKLAVPVILNRKRKRSIFNN